MFINKPTYVGLYRWVVNNNKKYLRKKCPTFQNLKSWQLCKYIAYQAEKTISVEYILLFLMYTTTDY